MAKFFVMVNGKFMVSLTAESNCAAEHAILDHIYTGMQTALSFDDETIKTDHFRGCLMDCATVSFDELQRISEDFRCAEMDVKNSKNAEIDLQDEINDLKRQLEELEARQEVLRYETESAQKRFDAIKTAIGYKDYF